MSGSSLEGRGEGGWPSRVLIVVLVLLTLVTGIGVAILTSHSTGSHDERIYELIILQSGEDRAIVVGNFVVAELECIGPYEEFVTIDLSLVFKSDLRNVVIRVYAGYDERAFIEPIVMRGVQLHYSWSLWGSECPLVVVSIEALGGRGWASQG